MSEIITVQLFTPVPAGLRGAQPNPMSREQILMPIPCYEYTGCRDVDIDELGRVICFTNRAGERIESNLLFIVKRETKSEGEA